MTLMDYLYENKLNLTELAAKANIHPSILYRISQGIGNASYASARAISEATSGVITIQYLMSVNKHKRSRKIPIL